MSMKVLNLDLTSLMTSTLVDDWISVTITDSQANAMFNLSFYSAESLWKLVWWDSSVLVDLNERLHWLQGNVIVDISILDKLFRVGIKKSLIKYTHELGAPIIV